MEPNPTKRVDGQFRYQLVLGKFQVIKVDSGVMGCKFVLSLGSGVNFVIESPPNTDVKVGDLLTLYTEVFSHDQSARTSIQ